jgi:hypothetical protein
VSWQLEWQIGLAHLFWWPFVILWGWQLVGDNATVICARSLYDLFCCRARTIRAIHSSPCVGQTAKSCDLSLLGAWPSALAWGLNSDGVSCDWDTKDWHTGYVAGDLRLSGQTVGDTVQAARCAALYHLKMGWFGAPNLCGTKSSICIYSLILDLFMFESRVKE